MHYFVAISCSDDINETEQFLAKIEQHYPLGDSFQLAANARIIRSKKVSSAAMLQETLFSKNDESLAAYGRFFITLFDKNYWGFHRKDLWQWLEGADGES